MGTVLGQSAKAPSFLPSCAVLELTYQCNHKCVFCSCPWYVADSDFADPPEMDLGEWIQTIDTLCELGVFELAFTGGEPLLKKGLIELLDHAASRQVHRIETEGRELVDHVEAPKLFLLSNGRQMTQEVIEACKRHQVHLSLSLPGLDTFGWHTGGADPQRVLDWFKVARRSGLRTTVGITVTKRNLHELAATMTEALVAGADNVLLNRFMPGGRGLMGERELSLDHSNLQQMLDTAEAVLRASKRYGHVGTELPRCVVTDPGRYQHLQVATTCSAAVDFFVIGPSGHIRVCNHSPVRLAHVSEIHRVRDDPYWRRFTSKNYMPDECAGCWAAKDRTCDGGCREAAHVASGSVTALDPMARPGLMSNRSPAETATSGSPLDFGSPAGAPT